MFAHTNAQTLTVSVVQLSHLLRSQQLHSTRARAQTSAPQLVWAAMGALSFALLVATICASAQSAYSHQQQQQQQQVEQQQLADYGSMSNELPSPPNAFQASQVNGYQHASAAPKSNKKIQIVYIKVPLAKLRPALGANATDVAHANAQTAGYASSAAAANQTTASLASNYTTQQLRDNGK